MCPSYLANTKHLSHAFPRPSIIQIREYASNKPYSPEWLQESQKKLKASLALSSTYFDRIQCNGIASDTLIQQMGASPYQPYPPYLQTEVSTLNSCAFSVFFHTTRQQCPLSSENRKCTWRVFSVLRINQHRNQRIDISLLSLDGLTETGKSANLYIRGIGNGH